MYYIEHKQHNCHYLHRQLSHVQLYVMIDLSSPADISREPSALKATLQTCEIEC